ncbi:MAG: DUF2283 domain-containing protein [Chloroflexota bacterium]|nr:DUF2283 domain-containing protein [Chloroflexota bacterium]
MTGASGGIGESMSVTFGHIMFDRVRYDQEGDVLYLHVGDPHTTVTFDASSEGHALRCDAAGRLVGVTIVNARWLLQREGQITITLPASRAPLAQINAEALAPALGLGG